jgi:hypothetical protein
MNKKILLTVAMLTLCMVFPGTSFAAEAELNDHDSDLDHTIVISSEKDWDDLTSEDAAAFQEIKESVNEQLLQDVQTYITEYNLQRYNDDGLLVFSEKIDVEDFLEQFPKYRKSSFENIEEEITLASAVVSAETVQNYFIVRQYKLSLELFNHSLVSNPADLYLNLNAGSDSFRQYIKDILNNEEDMVNDIVNYINGTASAPVGHAFPLSAGDLYYAIRKCDLSVTKTSSTSASFVIKDTYDFDGVENMLASQVGSNSFYFEISGKVSNGSVK